jgi:hypothetical protein
MIASLESALQSVDLVPGNYVCQIKNMRVEVQVTYGSVLAPSGDLDYSEEMLDPWVVEHPGKPSGTGGTPVKVIPGKLPPPQIPEFPKSVSQTIQ